MIPKTMRSWRRLEEPQYIGGEHAEAVAWDGTVLRFELIVAEPVVGWSVTTHHPPHGRLIQATDRNDAGYTVNYKSWTQTEIDQSPNRQWQIDTIVDSLGQTLEFEYNSQQQGGHWAISKITLPSTDELDYSYAGGFLSKVDYPDGSESTFSFSSGSNGLTEAHFNDIAAPKGHRHKTVYLSGSSAVVNGHVVPTSIGLCRMIANGEGEVTYMNAGETESGGDHNLIYEGGGKLKQGLRIGFDTGLGGVKSYIPYLYYQDGWTATSNAQQAHSPSQVKRRTLAHII